MNAVFDIPAPPGVPVANSTSLFKVRRIFCVGRNYAAHAREMGKDPDRDPPFFFTKFAETIMPNGAELPYPPQTNNYHFEGELVVAIGKAAFNVTVEDAPSLIFG
jgi:fumarylpyruvate hydrolase